MKYNSFKELEKEYSVSFSQEKYMEALTILKAGMDCLPEEEFEKNLFNIMMDKAQLNSKTEQYDECLKDLSYLIDRNYVCPLYWSRFSDPFHEREDYSKLRERNELLRNRIQEEIRSQWEVFLPSDYTQGKKYPLFINLHGDGDNTEFHKEFWGAEALLDRGFIVVYIQSTQLTSHDGYSWQDVALYSPDQEKWPNSKWIHKVSESSYWIRRCYDSAYDEIERCYETVKDKYSIDDDNIIIGGFSGGAVAAIDITMVDAVPIKGFVSLCTAKPTSFTTENIKGLLDRGVKGVFLEGEKDVPVKDVDEMVKAFEDNRIPYQYHINDGIGHWYPKDLDDKIMQSVEFILK